MFRTTSHGSAKIPIKELKNNYLRKEYYNRKPPILVKSC
uniref:Uncharacterized protein n=1 Tax=Myoviridae sp. ctcPl3 TaxID=2826669 RepID=A0A8S5QXJ1_9CAUD|nr:MAG TPA: hypothetical protein [Myoviridae sp. ctcPl3]